jgi:hypothetical protein
VQSSAIKCLVSLFISVMAIFISPASTSVWAET